MMDPDPSDDERYPTLTPSGRAMLEFMREHPRAPRFNNRSGNRLLASDLKQVRAFEAEVAAATIDWKPGVMPDWLTAFLERALARVPAYRDYGAPPARLADLPTMDRGDLGRDIARYVPDDLLLDRLINFRTSGVTGHPVVLPSHPLVAAGYLAFHKRGLRRFGVELTAGRGQVGVILLGHQRICFTYVSVTPTMDEAGLAKINLHPADWRDPEDRGPWLEAMNPEVLAGDPLSYAELLTIPTTSLRPKALMSTAMALSDGLRAALETRFACPVVDFYSMNEAGPVAVFDPAVCGHVLLQHRMMVEITDPDGMPLPPGERGEVTLTGGFNGYLPLIRYRTGDFAALAVDRGPEPVLVGLQGRRPVRFLTTDGTWINNIDVTHVLRPYAIGQYSLHQAADRALTLTLHGSRESDATLRRAILALFGAGQALEIRAGDGENGKVLQYSSDLAGSAGDVQNASASLEP